MTEMGRRPSQGDMLKSVYDTDENDIVDDSQKLESATKAQVQDHSPVVHAHPQDQVTDLVTDLAGKSAVGHAHIEADVTDLSHDAQKIKGVIIDDTGKADQKVLAYDLASQNIVYITQAPAGAVLESIQTLEADGAGYYNITAVDMLKTVLQFTFRTPYTPGEDYPPGFIYLYSTTQVFVQPFNQTIFQITVLEFASGIHDVQRDIIAIANAETIEDHVITEVDLSKAVLISTGCWAGNPLRRQNWLTARFLDSTHIRFQRSVSGSVGQMRYEILEFT